MPLLGKKQFSLAKALTNVGPDEEIYTIQHTQEQFRSKDEYEKRVELYKQGIWTCRCTGHTTLTHEEALKSEQAAMKTLRAQFHKSFEKSVLQLVHHSTESLDSLNDQAWTKLHQFLVEGESVSFKVNNGAKTLKGSVIGISPNVEDNSASSSKCNSPSSDKENSSDGKKSPKKWTPPKLLPHKYSVKLEEGPIINSVPVEDLVRLERPPSKDLVRLFIRSNSVRCGTTSTSPWVVDEPLVKKHALPSKFADFLLSPAKMAEAARRAEELGKKRKRQSQDGGAAKKQKLGDNAEKKAKNKLTPLSLNKKVKSDSGKAEKKKDPDKAQKKKREKKKENAVQKKSSPDKTKMKPTVIEIGDSSDEEVTLATIKKMKTVKTDGDSDSDVPLANLADQATPKKKTPSSTSGSTPNKQKKSDTPKKDKKTCGTPQVKKSDSEKSPGKRKRTGSTDSDIPLSKLTPTTPQKAVKSIKEKNETTPSKATTKAGRKSDEKRGRGRPRKGEEKEQKIPRKGLSKTLKGRYATIQDALNSVEKGDSIRKAAMDHNIPYETLRRVSKGWKQMTLLEIASKNKDHKEGKSSASATATPKKSPPKPQTPLIVKKLLALNKDEDRPKFNMLLKKAVMVLTPSQKKNLPSPIKEKVQRRIDLMEERRALEKMSESEREAYLKEKKEKQKKRMKEKMKQKMKEMRQRYEDQDLALQPLPAPRLVPTPDNLPNELFGDVAMVTEFISSYSGLLMPESEYPIYTDALMKALAGGSQGFAYLSRVLGVLLQTLLQDEIAEGYSELRVSLSDIAVNPYTASELVRLCLRKDDSGGSDADNDEEELEVPDSLIQQLETQEFFHLECEEKLRILRGLCLRVMGTYSVQDYMEEKQREAIQLTKQRVTEMKGFNEKLKEKKQKGEEKSSANTSAAEDTPTNGPTLTINSFYGKKLDDSSANDSPADSQGEEGSDNLLSIVKRRRLMVAKAAQEKEKRELQRRLQKEKEHEEERERRQREMFETKYKDGIYLARTVLRHVPIGYDRHHNRYWMFTQTTPGLFIEKGWVGQEISYNPGEVPDERSAENDTEPSSSTPSSSPSKEPGSPSKRLRLTKKKALVESTIPSCGQNLWFTYNSLKDLDALLHNLHPQGIREAALKTEIRKRYQDITRAIQNYQRNNLELRESDGSEEMVSGFKRELSDMEMRLRNGGLGGVVNFDKWESRLMAATDIATMGECLLETHEGILDKFLQKFMKLPKKEEEEGVKQEEEEEDEEAEDGDDEEEKVETAEEKKLSAAERRLQQWKDSVTNCSTMSRLHVLLSMMDSCIKWEKSAENAKCKICRKKGDDDRLLLCDECNQAFHMYCLRPQLIHVPKGDWFCAACVPHTKRRSRVPCRLGDETDSEEEDEPQHTNCEECGAEAGEEEGEELVACHKCPNVYHLDCHQPPLRRVPRGLWECADCKNGIRRRKKGRLQRKAASQKSYKSQVEEEEEESEEEEEEEEEESEEEESEEENPRAPAKASKSTRSSSNRRSGRNAEGGSSSGAGSSRSTRRSNDHQEEAPLPRSRRAPSDLSLCEDILQKMMKHSSSWPFLEPVNKKQVPDYHQIIKKPMDFQTMLKKCARLSYSSPQEFVDDAILVFSNAAKYNQSDSEVYSCMKEVEKLFAELLAKYLPDYASTQHFVAEDKDISARTRRSRRN